MGQIAAGAMQRVAAIHRHMRGGNFTLAVAEASSLIDSEPHTASHWAMRAAAQLKLGQMSEAVADYAHVNALEPDNPDYLCAFGSALVAAGEGDSSEACFLRALQLDDTHLESLLAIGSLYEKTGRTPDASPYILKAVQTHPTSAPACHAAGRFLHHYGERSDAAQFFAQAIKNDPKLPEPYRVLAGYLREADDLLSAVAMYDALLVQLPDDQMTLAERAHCLSHMNDWNHPGYRDFDAASKGQLACGASPFLYLPLEDNPTNARKRSEKYARKLIGAIAAKPLTPPKNDKLKIGYFSADFHDHATMHLIAGVLEAHDRSKVELFAYSYGPNLHDHMRARAVAAVDHFTDITDMDDYTAAHLAREHGLDIAIDLKGFTAGTRLRIFAHRAAPVQVSWLGYPGTTGAACMDYMIADDITVPDKMTRHYSETVIALPGCYQPNDRDRPLPDRTLQREDVGLPSDGFVFCSFNASYKLSPREFDIWMRLLREVPGSVLWQLDGGEVSRENLRKAAEDRDVDPARLIFAPRVSQAEHLGRMALADLFLDTFNCNAHTTASDSLWAGVPVLTVLGNQFAARVAASLCTAVGTPETICDSPESYATMALALAQDPAALAGLRQRLEDGRDTCALFDTVRFTRNLENALFGLTPI